jgi:hypothetical protein
MAKQVYDKEGTTSFQFTFIDKSLAQRKGYKEWHVFFSQGFISISDYSTDTRIKISFPEEDHWVYQEREVEWRGDGLCRGSEIKTCDFNLRVDVREYDDSDEEGMADGFLELNTKIGYISILIPYKLALILMKFMAGSTDLEGIYGVHKSK